MIQKDRLLQNVPMFKTIKAQGSKQSVFEYYSKFGVTDVRKTGQDYEPSYALAFPIRQNDRLAEFINVIDRVIWKKSFGINPGYKPDVLEQTACTR